MKQIITFFSALIIAATVFAQSPEKMSYQAVVRNINDSLIVNQTLGMQISILKSSISGLAVYVETHTPETNDNGLVTIEIGSGTSSDDFSTIDWSNGPYFIKTETDLTSGVNYTITGTSQLLSVPYSFHAKTSDSLTGHFVGELYGGGIVFWVSPDKQHGLIASLHDLDDGSGVAWSATQNISIGDLQEV